MSGESVFKRKGEVMLREIAGEVLLIPVQGELANMQRIYGLNPVSRAIWERLDGVKTVGAIAAELTGEFETTAEQCTADAVTFLGTLLDAGLVELVLSDV